MSKQVQDQKTHKSSRGKSIVVSMVVIAIVAVIGWISRDYWYMPAGKPFVVIKSWSESVDGQTSVGFEWIHRQCRENLAELDLDGRARKKGALEISRLGSRVWSFKLRPDVRWSDDGKPVTVQDYLRAWDLRKGVVKASNFQRIKNIKSTDANTLEVELDGSEDPQLDGAALSSIWMTAIKASTSGTWGLKRELEGPCDGPYLIRKKNGSEVLLVRNKYWYGYDPSMIPSVKILLDDGSGQAPFSKKPLVELFNQGLVSFVEPNVGVDSSQAQVAVSGRVFLEPKAHYIVINPRGLVGGELNGFTHAAINRGELAALVQRPKTMSSMYRLLPLSLPAVDNSGNLIDLSPVNHESVAQANKLLGINSSTVNAKASPPFKRKLVILAKPSPDLDPLVQRFMDRIGANYNISCEIVRPSEDGKLPTTWDTAFVEVNLGKGFGGWANEMSQVLQKYAPSRSDMIGKFNALAKTKSGTAVPRQTLVDVMRLDEMAPKSAVLVPLGQFGAEVLIEDGVLDVSWIGDAKRDPDVSRARRIPTRTKG